MVQQSTTGTKNENYDLISIIYHLLQNASTCEVYIKDAEQAGDRQLMDFFAKIKEESCQQAEQAKQMLAKRI